MGLKAGSLDDFEGSMAAAMEAAMVQEYGQLPEVGTEDRRRFLIAIARGLLTYLSDQNQVIGEVKLQPFGLPITTTYKVAGLTLYGS